MTVITLANGTETSAERLTDTIRKLKGLVRDERTYFAAVDLARLAHGLRVVQVHPYRRLLNARGFLDGNGLFDDDELRGIVEACTHFNGAADLEIIDPRETA